MMNYWEDSFLRVRQEMGFLREESSFLRQDIEDIKKVLIELGNSIPLLNSKLDGLNKKILEIPLSDRQTFRHINPTDSTHSSTVPHEIKGLKPEILGISTGNKGVPTDRQTHQQTDISTQKTLKIQENTIKSASEILDSLDSMKKEIRLKFKKLTEQEMIVFTTLYQFDQERGFTNYKELSNKLNLTESSIRDYVGRLIKKGIPVDKSKINNKSIQLSISSDLKKIASLHTILQLRDL